MGKILAACWDDVFAPVRCSGSDFSALSRGELCMCVCVQVVTLRHVDKLARLMVGAVLYHNSTSGRLLSTGMNVPKALRSRVDKLMLCHSCEAAWVFNCILGLQEHTRRWFYVCICLIMIIIVQVAPWRN